MEQTITVLLKQIKSALFGIGLWQKLFFSRKNISCKAIQNGSKSNSMLLA